MTSKEGSFFEKSPQGPQNVKGTGIKGMRLSIRTHLSVHGTAHPMSVGSVRPVTM